MPFDYYNINYTLIYYQRKTLLKDEYEEYIKEKNFENLLEEEVYERVFLNSEKKKGSNLPNGYLE